MITLIALIALAQEPAKAEATEAVVVDFKGAVDVKRPSDKDWAAAEKNMKLGKGSEICTGAASGATLLFPAGLTVELKAVTLVKLDDLFKAAKEVRTGLRLKFGSVEIELKKTDVEAGLKVATPNATTSVSGSKASMFAWAQGSERFISLVVELGKWMHRHNASGVEDAFGPGDKTNDRNDLANDLSYMFWSDLYQNFFGRDEGELYQDPFGLKAHDFTTGLNPTFEGGFGSLNPFADAITQPTALPLPPAPPIP